MSNQIKFYYIIRMIFMLVFNLLALLISLADAVISFFVIVALDFFVFMVLGLLDNND